MSTTKAFNKAYDAYLASNITSGGDLSKSGSGCVPIGGNFVVSTQQLRSDLAELRGVAQANKLEMVLIDNPGVLEPLSVVLGDLMRSTNFTRAAEAFCLALNDVVHDAIEVTQ